MVNNPKSVVIRDSTLREGLDTPGVAFSLEQKVKIARLLDKANVPEIEIAAPSNVLGDLELAKKLDDEGLQIKTSGLIYSYNPRSREEIKEASKSLDRIDILMPLSPKRKPHDSKEKRMLLAKVLEDALRFHSDVGAGFPHSSVVEPEFLLEIGHDAVQHGAGRITIYDTNGSSDPFEVYDPIKGLKKELSVSLFFHGHNDLGLASANALSAIHAGADGLDVTINGLGDRAGNASLEQVVLALHLRGIETGVVLKDVPRMSKIVEEASGIDLSKLAPVVGEYVFCHESPSHLENPELFEAFDPKLIGSHRKFAKS